MYEYKSVTFGCAFNTRYGLNLKLQGVLDAMAKEGWRLHTMQVAGASASMCVLVFERKIETEEQQTVLP